MQTEGQNRRTALAADRTDEVIDKGELACRLNINIRTVSRMVARGELPRPCIGQGGRPRWLWCYVVTFLQKQHERAATLDRRTGGKLR